MILPYPVPNSESFINSVVTGFVLTSFSNIFLTISSAFHILISPDSINSSTTLSKISGVAPAVIATLRAWSVIWPRWTPSVHSARKAEKFWARPTAPITSANSFADEMSKISCEILTDGLDCNGPPTIPTFKGISIIPSRSPASFLYHLVNEV